MPKKRKLSDLYIKGKDVTVDDGEGTPVTVYVKKLNPVEHEKAMRKANAARAAAMSKQNLAPGEQDRYMYAEELGEYMKDRDQLYEYLIAEDMTEIIAAREAELAAEDEWADNDYLQGLKDAWIDEDSETDLRERYFLDENDEEAVHVFNELSRFNNQVEKASESEKRSLIRDLEELSDEELYERAVDRSIALQANIVWLTEYRLAQIWLAVRGSKSSNSRYFEQREEVDELAAETLKILIDAYQELTVEPIEGKDLDETPIS